jgi:ATP-dependent Clp protease ATP-binding subunit ClpB
VRGHFRPEFLNRIDDIVLFHPLSRVHMATIIDHQMGLLLKRLEERKMRVSLTGAAKAHLVAEGYDPVYGARPLKRTIQRLVLDPLALRVLQGEFAEGDEVVVDLQADQLQFSKPSATIH